MEKILKQDDIRNIAFLYFEKKETLKQISEQYNVCVNTIKRILKKYYNEQYAVESKRNYKNLKINPDFFEKIDTEAKAYLLGFFISDGNVYFDTSYRLRFCLAEQDIDILYKFKEILNLDSQIRIRKRKERKNSQSECLLCWSSEKQFKDLAKYGVIPNKTLKTFLPIDLIEPSVLHHFIRGLFDGDGCISVHSKYKRALSFVGTEKLIVDLKEFLCKTLDLYFVKISKRTKKNTVYQIMWSSLRDVSKLYEYMYKDATIYLDRKFQKFQNI